MIVDEYELFVRIKQRDRTAFDSLFRKYYTRLCRFSYALCLLHEDAEESVQETFITLWEKAPLITIDTSLQAYLYTAVRNHTLNIIQKKKTEQRYRAGYAELNTDNDENNVMADSEISKLIWSGVEHLPEKCREIFILCKYEGLSYEEIADYLNLSAKTVENQMGIALRKLREDIAPRFRKLRIMIAFFFRSWGK